MFNKLETSSLNPYILLLAILILAGVVGNYLRFPFGFGIDFLFGSIATLIIISLYGIWWGIFATVIISSVTILLGQHPYDFIILTCESLFIIWRLRKGNHNLLFIDIIFWFLIGMPLIGLVYGSILQVGGITTLIILLKQSVNGIFNALVASLILTYKPLYKLVNAPSRKAIISLEQILLKLLVAFVLIPSLLLIVMNNRIAIKHEQNKLIATLDSSVQNLAVDIRQWHQSGLSTLRLLAATSSETELIVEGKTQHNIELAMKSLPLFDQICIINSERKVIALAHSTDHSGNSSLDLTQLDIPRKPQILVIPKSIPENNSISSKPRILQTLPIIIDERWLGNIVAELNLNFIEQLLQQKTHYSPLQSTLLDENQILIASTNTKINSQQPLNRYQKGKISYIQSDSLKNTVYHWLPTIDEKPLIYRWQDSFYSQEIMIHEEIPLILRMEASAAPYINYLQLLYIRSLIILLLIILISILIAKFVSRLLVQSILNLTKFTNNLPKKILRHETISLPRTSIKEMNLLTSNFEVMSTTIEQNIRQIQQTNQQLQQAKEIAEIANKSKEQFLANISHELKTPLNSIMGYSKLIEKKIALYNSRNNNGEKLNISDWLEIVNQNSKYLLSLLDEILDFSKTRANKTKLHPSIVKFDNFIEEVLNITAEKATEKNIDLKYEASGNLPTTIYADQKRLKQVLLNLLNNAIKFAQQGEVVLKVSQLEYLENIDYTFLPQVSIRFAVIDQGIGIASQDLPKIFEPFEQVGKLEVNNNGTGLGLAICKMLVELMGGKLKVKSSVKEGSTFWFDLVFPEIKVTSEIEPQSFVEIIGYKGQELTILVVDDDNNSRSLLVDILQPLGFKIITAENGEEALQLALENNPDIILTDLFMPIKTGFTLASTIRNLEDFKHTPIIAISASSFKEIEYQSRAMGCDEFLEKPVNSEELLNLLGKYKNLEWIYI